MLSGYVGNSPKRSMSSEHKSEFLDICLSIQPPSFQSGPWRPLELSTLRLLKPVFCPITDFLRFKVSPSKPQISSPDLHASFLPSQITTALCRTSNFWVCFYPQLKFIAQARHWLPLIKCSIWSCAILGWLVIYIITQIQQSFLIPFALDIARTVISLDVVSAGVVRLVP